jgi:GGDEF domain-containing protein
MEPLTLEWLARTALFRGVDATPVLERLKSCERRAVAAGEVVYAQGAAVRSAYLVLTGRLREESAPGVVRIVREGECAGALPALSGRPAAAPVHADVASTLVLLPAEFLWALADGGAPLARNLLQLACDRPATASDEPAQDLSTGARSRHWLDAEVSRRFQKYQNEDRPLALVVFEIEGACDDRALLAVARAAEAAVGRRGAVARLEGVRFAVLVDPEHVAHAAAIASAVRDRVQAAAPSLTVRAGSAVFEDRMSAVDLFARAAPRGK